MRQWYAFIEGKQYGPVSENEIRSWLREGRLQRTDTVWADGMADWVPVSQVPELTGAAAASPSQPTAAYDEYDVPGACRQPAGYAPRGDAYIKPHRGGMILTFGILGLVCCFIFGIVAWVMATTDLNEMRSGQMDPSGEGQTNAGRILGIISVILGPIVLIINVLAFMAQS